MTNWIIRSTDPNNSTYEVLVGNCDRDHAESVVETLRLDPAHPDEFYLDEVTEAHPKAVRFFPNKLKFPAAPVADTPTKKSFWRRLSG